MSAMRRIWLWSPMRREAVKRAKTEHHYRCERCKRLTGVINVDHDPPVVPLTGFDSWDGIFERMFVPADKLRILCHDCHTKITQTQRENRKKFKKLCKQQ
jgi:hypothetical protein